MEHTTPLTAAAVRALVEARKHDPRIGNEWVLPSPRWPDKAVSRSALDRWLARAQAKAGLPPLGWHSFRRKFANELHEAPLKDLCTLGRVEGSENHPSVLSSPRSRPDATRAGGTETVGHSGPEPTVKPTVMGSMSAPLSTDNRLN